MTVFRPPHGDDCPICRQDAEHAVDDGTMTGAGTRRLFLVVAFIIAVVLLGMTIDTRSAFGAALPSQTVPELIVEGASRYGLDAGLMQRIAWCESLFEPFALNRSGAAGLYQFLPPTWQHARSGAGLEPHRSVYDPRANVDAAMWLAWAEGVRRHWAACL